MDEIMNEERWEAEESQDEGDTDAAQEDELEAEEDEEEAISPLVRRMAFPGSLSVRRTRTIPVKGMRQVVLRTPSGVARMKLPAALPTAREVNRVTGRFDRQLATHATAIRDLGASTEKNRRALRRIDRENVRAANATMFALLVSQVKEAVLDVYAQPRKSDKVDQPPVEDEVEKQRKAQAAALANALAIAAAIREAFANQAANAGAAPQPVAPAPAIAAGNPPAAPNAAPNPGVNAPAPAPNAPAPAPVANPNP